MDNKYIFTSARLGFRNWHPNDLATLADLNADAEVMAHFPKVLTESETKLMIKRFQTHFDNRGYTYFAAEIVETGELIGFIGLLYQDYDSPFTPATDIGWRLKRAAWGNGYATEGAKRCLDYALNELKLEKVISVCTVYNSKSENVMKKIGMTKVGNFKHPKLIEFPDLEECTCYQIRSTENA